MAGTWNVRKPSELTQARKHTGVHSWYHVKGFRFPWPICSRCGLIWLKNEISRRAAKGPCVWTEDLV